MLASTACEKALSVAALLTPEDTGARLLNCQQAETYSSESIVVTMVAISELWDRLSKNLQVIRHASIHQHLQKKRRMTVQEVCEH